MGAYTDLLRRFGHQRWWSAVGPRLVGLDRVLHRWSGGRMTVVGRSKLPMLLLTTTGRRTGRARTTPLLYAEDEGAYLLTASNWGSPRHPAWSENLLADPECSVTVSGREVPVRARLVEGSERERLWPVVAAVWPAYDTYARRTDRAIRVHALEPR